MTTPSYKIRQHYDLSHEGRDSDGPGGAEKRKGWNWFRFAIPAEATRGM